MTGLPNSVDQTLVRFPEGYAPIVCIHESPTRLVYRARRLSDGHTVILKFTKNPHPTLTDLAKIHHEYALLQECAIPGVVKPLELISFGNGIALVMEDLGDVTLHRRLTAGPLPLLEALQIGESLASILATLHQRNVIHRDLKPSNLLFHKDTGSIHLIDFGIATRLKQETPQPKPHERIEGTPAYMSPEQTGRMNRVCDLRTDLYSLGVTLYEALTGVLPFQSQDPVELIHSHIARKPTPPHIVLPTVPETVSNIVAKLLSKMPEDRYTHAESLSSDLLECRAQLLSRGSIAPFPLGLKQRTKEFRLSQKLYGRETEIQQLLASFERASRGKAELILVAGYSGVGKSALVQEIHKPIAQLNGVFVSGKFDQFNRSVPYAPLTLAIRGLLQHILSSTQQELSCWKSKLQSALGKHWSILADLFPELSYILEATTPPSDAGLLEAQHRFITSFVNLISTLTSAERPLVLFLDDLQWADAASLTLIQRLLADSDAKHLLLIGAYRNNEVHPGHLFALHLEELNKRSVPITHIVLSPLEVEHIANLLSDSTEQIHTSIQHFAELIHTKTGGNAFFVSQFILSCYKQGFIYINHDGEWQWNIDSIHNEVATDNVITFLLKHIRQLPVETRRLLSLAACIGHQFDIATLALFHEKTIKETAIDLDPALKEGFIIPLDSNYRYLTYFSPSRDSTLHVTFKFLHDRVQQAAYAIIDEGKRREVHLWNGRVMLARYRRESNEKELFDLVGQMNIGAPLIDDPEERVELAKLNLLAGEKAQQSTAYDTAFDLLTVSAQMLGEDGWEFDYDITFSVHIKLAQIEFLRGNPEIANRLLSDIEQKANNKQDEADCLILRVTILTYQRRFAEAIDCGIKAAALLEQPIDILASTISTEMLETEWLDLDRQLVDLLAGTCAPQQPASHIKWMRLCFSMMPAVSVVNQGLMVSIVFRAIKLSLLHGLMPETPYFIVLFASLCQRFGKHRPDAFDTAMRALSISDRFPQHTHASHLVFGQLISHWKQPVSVGIQHLQQAFKKSHEQGDYVRVETSLAFCALYRFLSGTNLTDLSRELEEHLLLLKRAGIEHQTSEVAFVLEIANAIRDISGPVSLQNIDELQTFLPQQEDTIARLHYFILRQIYHYFAGDFEISLTFAGHICKYETIVNGFLSFSEHLFYRLLARMAQIKTAQLLAGSPEHLELEKSVKLFSAWASDSPENYLARYVLLSAECSRCVGDANHALILYDKAIELSEVQQCLQIQALASELCARFHLSWNRKKVSQVYMIDAHYLYTKCGYQIVANAIQDKYAEFFTHSGQLTVTKTTTNIGPSRSTAIASNAQLDAATAIRAAQALSSELDLNKLIERLMWILMENVGADRGILLLNRNNVLYVSASISINSNVVQSGMDEEVTSSSQLPLSLIRYVDRTRETVLLDNAVFDSRFATDPYIVRVKPKSVLALAMTHKGRLSGIAYFENNLATQIFSQTRIELLQVIAAQAAIAVENALLYMDLRKLTDQLRHTNENLEQQVTDRTAELRNALNEIWSEMDLARKIQTLLLPTQPVIRGYEVYGTMVPATTVGGDYYDIFQVAERDWLLVGDVSGHGVPAGLIMMMAQTAVRTISNTLSKTHPDFTPSQLLEFLNTTLRENIQLMKRSDYMTLLAMQISGSKIRFAGMHQDILIYRNESGRVDRIATSGVWMGFIDQVNGLLEDSEFELHPGDIALLFTDGAIECRSDGTLLATEGLAALFSDTASREKTAQGIVRSLLSQIQSLKTEDDITILALKRTDA
jgi:predicted ATPase/serine phosphatase RsbU (regulator of sigma subunit)